MWVFMVLDRDTFRGSDILALCLPGRGTWVGGTTVGLEDLKKRGDSDVLASIRLERGMWVGGTNLRSSRLSGLEEKIVCISVQEFRGSGALG